MQSNWNSYNHSPSYEGAHQPAPKQEYYSSSSYYNSNEPINEMYSSNYDMLQQSQERARKAAHSALERQRRERMNNKIQKLRSLLPNTAQTQNMSKLDILQYSIDYINELQNQIRKSGQRLPDMKFSQPRQPPGPPSFRSSAPEIPFKSFPQESNFITSHNEQEYMKQNNFVDTRHPIESANSFQFGDSFYPSQTSALLQGNSFTNPASEIQPTYSSSRIPVSYQAVPFPTTGSLTPPEDMERSHVTRLPPISNTPLSLNNTKQTHANVTDHFQTPISPNNTQQYRYSESLPPEVNIPLNTSRNQRNYPIARPFNTDSLLKSR
ncbi:hypothetical protein HK096_000987 [Nowakowskiella sp. JEL0078]|nr:hypothetical protein HK096_000987 [Nowakowskiella sp. JEL0078]